MANHSMINTMSLSFTCFFALALFPFGQGINQTTTITCPVEWAPSCQDTSEFRSVLNMGCQEHTIIDCTKLNEIGLSEQQVFDVINSCPCSCQIECGTWTMSPTASPTSVPTLIPTATPTGVPTKNPTWNPTNSPTKNPTRSPTNSPTKNPTMIPTTPSPTAVHEIVYSDPDRIYSNDGGDNEGLGSNDNEETYENIEPPVGKNSSKVALIAGCSSVPLFLIGLGLYVLKQRQDASEIVKELDIRDIEGLGGTASIDDDDDGEGKTDDGINGQDDGVECWPSFETFSHEVEWAPSNESIFSGIDGESPRRPQVKARGLPDFRTPSNIPN